MGNQLLALFISMLTFILVLSFFKVKFMFKRLSKIFSIYLKWLTTSDMFLITLVFFYRDHSIVYFQGLNGLQSDLASSAVSCYLWIKWLFCIISVSEKSEEYNLDAYSRPRVHLPEDSMDSVDTSKSSGVYTCLGWL